eukprot:6474695-Amphidinium_carterae.1
MEDEEDDAHAAAAAMSSSIVNYSSSSIFRKAKVSGGGLWKPCKVAWQRAGKDRHRSAKLPLGIRAGREGSRGAAVRAGAFAGG